ncbi:MAG: hypothetical protein P1U42_10150 [Phycisphaerales bacterium]|nr:hypothetical protein [Phycisphaerales bacterium]
MLNKPKQNHHSHGSYTRNLALMMCLGMLAGVLIWAKLRLVTDIPRSAYADPRETQAELSLDESESDYSETEDTIHSQNDETSDDPFKNDHSKTSSDHQD